jgi:hypothetical protein
MQVKYSNDICDIKMSRYKCITLYCLLKNVKCYSKVKIIHVLNQYQVLVPDEVILPFGNTPELGRLTVAK